MLSTEQELLGSLGIAEPGPAEQRSLASLLDRVADTSVLVALAQRERMACILYRNLSVSDLLYRLPEDHRDTLHEDYRGTAVLNLQLTHDIEELLGELEDRGMPIVLLKGVALLAEIYGDVGLRPMTDADLWVRRDDWQEVAETLARCGYQADAQYPKTFRRGATTLDLHTDLLGSERVQGRAKLLAAGEDLLFDSAREMTLGAQRARGLCRHDEVLYLSLHALKHNVGRLIWLVEINHLVGRFGDADWTALMDRARQMQQQRSLGCIAYLADLMLTDHCDARLAEAARDAEVGSMEKRLLRRRAESGALPALAPLLFFSADQKLGGRVAYTLETLFPRPEILRQIVHDGNEISVGRLYWRRLCQLVERAVR